MAIRLRFEIENKSIQRIVPQNVAERFEGIAFSSSGNCMAIATSETNCVLLFRRTPDGRFEHEPFQRIGESPKHLQYPHDVSFAKIDDIEMLAIAQRAGAVAIYKQNASHESFDRDPECVISGPRSTLAYSDAVAFVPPDNDYVAACNLQQGSILFFRRLSSSPILFAGAPDFELRHPTVVQPDGLAFSRCGGWLATANHGGGSVTVFQRCVKFSSGRRLTYQPEPVTVIKDPGLRYPHSVAFTPRTNHLAVTNAGANYFSIYAPIPTRFGLTWSQSPVVQVIGHEDAEFQKVNVDNKMEGGPKGIAIHKAKMAVCSPQIGVKVYSFSESSRFLTTLKQVLVH
jgi:hypothetical protein